MSETQEKVGADKSDLKVKIKKPSLMKKDEEFGFSLEHLLFQERKCRVCGETKDLVNEFYLIRKNKRNFPSGYSYECKLCTVKRIVKNRKKNKVSTEWSYPDW